MYSLVVVSIGEAILDYRWRQLPSRRNGLGRELCAYSAVRRRRVESVLYLLGQVVRDVPVDRQ